MVKIRLRYVKISRSKCGRIRASQLTIRRGCSASSHVVLLTCVNRLQETDMWSRVVAFRKVAENMLSPEVLAIYLRGLRNAGLPEG
jgi:hypothetical protein